jgi:hypothetical protein
MQTPTVLQNSYKGRFLTVVRGENGTVKCARPAKGYIINYAKT